MMPAQVGVVGGLVRYPVKSMLGEPCDEATISERGLAQDRRYALLDLETQRIASAKKPDLWRSLLACRARQAAGNVPVIVLPGGEEIPVDSPYADEALSRFVGRPVRLIQTAPAGAELERARPEEVLRLGPSADVAVDIGRLARAAPEGCFFDYAPVHLLSTGSVRALAGEQDEPFESARYRPNILIETPSGPGLPEDGWVGRDLLIGEHVRLRVLLPTPRCAVPTLAQGDLPQRPDALTRVMQRHRVPVEGKGVLPCLGVYAQVMEGGLVRRGDAVRLAEQGEMPCNHG